MIVIDSILEELRSPESPKALSEALRAVKNDIVGHSQRKELWIRKGLVDCLVYVLETHGIGSKQNQQEDQDRDQKSSSDVRLQTITIFGSLAHGGPAFISPLRIGHLYPALLQILSSSDYGAQSILAALRCLNAIADAVELEEPEDKFEQEEFLKLLYTDTRLRSINQILNQESPNHIIQQQITLAIELIGKTANSERRRKQLRISKILDTLATRLSPFVANTPGFRPQPGIYDRRQDIPPLHPKARLAPLLLCICNVISESKIRAGNFCLSDIWSKVFGSHERDPYSFRAPIAKKPENGATKTTKSSKNVADHPPLGRWGSLGSTEKVLTSSAVDEDSLEGFTSSDDDDTPLVAWLIEIIRTKDGITRLAAIWLIGVMFRSQFVCAKRKSSLSMLLVPALVSMLDDGAKSSNAEDAMSPPLAKTTSRLIKELSPKVLSYFVQDCKLLQTSAAEGGAIKKLSQLLKRTFDPIPADLLMPLWNAHEAAKDDENMNLSESSRLGRQGVQPIIHHTLQVRESLLLAISAMATLENENRQAIINNGVIPCVVESLQPDKARRSSGGSSEMGKLKNTNAILIAACATTRTLSRSVQILRTSLVDAGLQKPIFDLLKYPNINVQIAATAAVANILLPFSALRNVNSRSLLAVSMANCKQDVADSGVMHILCERAHSADSKLRVNALWALSNLAVQSDNESKIRMVKELSPGWLKQIICTGSEDDVDIGGYRGHSLFGQDSLNEHTELFTTTAANKDEYSSRNYSNLDVDMLDDTDIEGLAKKPSRLLGGSDLATDEWFDAEVDQRTAAIQAARDDLAIQEQGLNLLRNLLVGGTEINEIVDYLFAEMGQDNLFEIFTGLLTPKSIDSTRASHLRHNAPTKLVPPPTEIVSGVVYILTHIAGSAPRHKQIIISQTRLFQLLLPLFNHPLEDIRVTLLWLVINLCWKDDDNDGHGALSRALELKRMGIVAKVQEASQDGNLNVRERAKHAKEMLGAMFRDA